MPRRAARRLALRNVPPGSGGAMIDGKRGPLLPVLLPMLAGPGLRRRRFALKDSDPLWAVAHVESYAADTCPDAPPGASNCGF